MASFTHQFSRLRFKIIGSLLVVLSLSMGTALFGMWSYQRGKLLATHHQKAIRTGRTIVAGLKYSMLQNNREAIQNSLEEMTRVGTFQAMSLLNKEGRIVYSSNRSLIGKILDENRDETCRACHAAGANPGQDAVVISGPGADHILRTVIPIENKPLCHECHAAEQKLSGILVIDDSLAETYEMLKIVTQRLVLGGIVTFLVIVALISSIVTRFVSSPVQALMQGIKGIETGDFKTWVEIEGSGEFSEMADSFNIMTRALGRYINEIHSKTREINTLYTIVKRMSETIDWHKIKNILVDLLYEILEAESVVLCLPTDIQNRRLEIIWKEHGDKRHYHAGFALDSDGGPHPSVSKDDLEQWLRGDFSVPSFSIDDTKVLMPMIFNEIQLGLICAVKATPARFSPVEKKLLPDLIKHVAVSFANARLYNLATTDDLTSLYTKGFFETRIKEFLNRFYQTGEGFSIIMIDLDHFKEVNDTYGHPVGDRVLRQIADVIRESMRHVDVSCRYGGEEFVILLPEEKIRSTAIIANRLREKVASHTFRIEDIPAFKKTVSIGIACCPQHATSAEELVAMADEALYAAKQHGRNQVYFLPLKQND
jgi:diguanylate cyclase (GGDEF)-like protein